MKSKNPIQCYAHRNLVHACVEITVISPGKGGTPDAIGGPLIMTPVEEGSYVAPTLQLPYDSAQQLMDELWNCNVRPSEGTGSLGQLGAMKENLADLRAQLQTSWGMVESLRSMISQLLDLKK